MGHETITTDHIAELDRLEDVVQRYEAGHDVIADALLRRVQAALAAVLVAVLVLACLGVLVYCYVSGRPAQDMLGLGSLLAVLVAVLVATWHRTMRNGDDESTPPIGPGQLVVELLDRRPRWLRRRTV